MWHGVQVGAPSPPITPDMLRLAVLPSAGFWVLLGGVGVGLLVMYAFVHERYALRWSWVYLAESSLISTLTVVSARCFASFLPPPMPGRLEYFYHYPDWLYSWGSMVCLALTAMGGLLFQNAALMHFKASEVVPVYFCMFALGGVVGSGLAFGELNFPWVLLLAPGVGFCITGVFAISYRREERIAMRLLLVTSSGDGPRGSPPSGRQDSHASIVSRDSSPVSSYPHGSGSGWGLGNTAGVHAPECSGLGRCSAADFSRGMSGVSEACSVASHASLEGDAFLTIGGGSMSSVAAMYRMASLRSERCSGERCSGEEGVSVSLPTALHLPQMVEPPGRFGTSSHSSAEALLSRCSETSGSSAASAQRTQPPRR